MDIIAEGSQVIEIVSGEESIISGLLTKISIYNQDNHLNIDLSIDLMYSKKFKKILIQILDVVEYSFFYNRNTNFYYIEDYKFFKNENLIYISLDPAEGSKTKVDAHDNDYASGKNMRLFA
jgi:hypothetical protein